MKRLIAIVMLLLTALSVGGVILYSVHKEMTSGGRSPEISFAQEEIEVETNADDFALLEGVTASDKEDGDITDSLMVEHVSKFVEDSVVDATYVVYDSQNHVARASRRVRYTNYVSPRFGMTAPMVFTARNVADMLDNVTARDAIDGDISLKVHASYDNTTADLANVGIHEVEISVTNSLGDTSRLMIPVRVVEDVIHSESIPLKDYLVYIKKGEAFDPRAYLAQETEENTDDKDREKKEQIQVSSNVNTSAPGVYAVDYTLVRNEMTAAMTRLIVVVTD